MARQSFPDDEVRESPLDFSFCVRRYFDCYRPAVLVLVEGELWPNLLAVAGKRGVPVHVVNARVSDRSFGRYRLLTRIWPGFLAPVRKFLVQAAGAPSSGSGRSGSGTTGSRSAGNVKFDNARVEDPGAAAARDPRVGRDRRRRPGRRRRQHASGRGSGRRRRRSRTSNVDSRPPCSFWPHATSSGSRRSGAPRWRRLERPCAGANGQPERALRASSSTRSGSSGGSTPRRMSAFIGGSLSPIGGHNLLEPARFGIPMVVGPHLQSVRNLASTFEQSGALTVVKDRDDLAARLRAGFSDRVGAAARGRKAQAVDRRQPGRRAQVRGSAGGGRE